MGIPTNYISLIGRVGKYKDCKCFESGVILTTINLGVKRGEKWDNFFIDFYDNSQRETASELCDNVKEGEYIQVKAKLRENRYTPEHLKGKVDEKGNPLTVSQVKIIGFDFKKVSYNEETEEWQYITK